MSKDFIICFDDATFFFPAAAASKIQFLCLFSISFLFVKEEVTIVGIR